MQSYKKAKDYLVDHYKAKVIENIINLQHKHNTISSQVYTKNKLKPSVGTIKILFGSWNDAVVAAGLTPNKRSLSIRDHIERL